jgi:hypothetical protein
LKAISSSVNDVKGLTPAELLNLAGWFFMALTIFQRKTKSEKFSNVIRRLSVLTERKGSRLMKRFILKLLDTETLFGYGADERRKATEGDPEKKHEPESFLNFLSLVCARSLGGFDSLVLLEEF